MKLGLINSAWAQAGKGTAYGIRMTKEIGFDTIDIFADPLDMDVKERRLIQHECDKAGLPIVSIACVATGLVDFNPSVQRFSLQRCRAYLDLVYEYQAKNLLLVLGEYIWEQQVIPPKEQWQTAVKNCRELGKVARHKGEEAKVAIRNVRRHAKDALDRMAREGETGEDEVRRAEKELDETTSKYVSHVDDVVKNKESELLEV